GVSPDVGNLGRGTAARCVLGRPDAIATRDAPRLVMASLEGITNARRTAGLMRTVRAGLVHHQAGRLDRAEELYQKVLEKDPDHPDALHLLGVVAYQRGEIGPALQLIERALPRLVELPDAHLNHGNALRVAGWLAEAIESYRRAVALDSDH